MICPNFHEICHKDEIEVGELLNCQSYLAVVCSTKCEEQMTADSNDGSWMLNKNAKKG